MIPVAAATAFTPLQGGIPIAIDGRIVGGIGVSGAASAQQDEEIALAGAQVFTQQVPAEAVSSRTRLVAAGSNAFWTHPRTGATFMIAAVSPGDDDGLFAVEALTPSGQSTPRSDPNAPRADIFYMSPSSAPVPATTSAEGAPRSHLWIG